MLFATVGAALAILPSFVIARLLSAMLYKTEPFDVSDYGIAALLLFAVVFLASFLPARRATRIQPILALKYN